MLVTLIHPAIHQNYCHSAGGLYCQLLGRVSSIYFGGTVCGSKMVLPQDFPRGEEAGVYWLVELHEAYTIATRSL